MFIENFLSIWRKNCTDSVSLRCAMAAFFHPTVHLSKLSLMKISRLCSDLYRVWTTKTFQKLPRNESLSSHRPVSFSSLRLSLSLALASSFLSRVTSSSVPSSLARVESRSTVFVFRSVFKFLCTFFACWIIQNLKTTTQKKTTTTTQRPSEKGRIKTK
jgi:hypothetical protein